VLLEREEASIDTSWPTRTGDGRHRGESGSRVPSATALGVHVASAGEFRPAATSLRLLCVTVHR